MDPGAGDRARRRRYHSGFRPAARSVTPAASWHHLGDYDRRRDETALALTDDEISRIKQGQTIRLLSRQDIGRLDIAGIDDMTDLILAIGDNKPLALLERDGIELHPVRVFNL